MTEKFFTDGNDAQRLVTILGLPHFHHHEKHSVTKTASAISLSKQGLHPSASFLVQNPLRRGSSHPFTSIQHSSSASLFRSGRFGSLYGSIDHQICALHGCSLQRSTRRINESKSNDQRKSKSQVRSVSCRHSEFSLVSIEISERCLEQK